MAEKNTNAYNDDSIEVLEGLEAVRKRPGMYIGSTDTRGLHHLVWEIVDNSIDEVMAGFATKINVTMEKDGSITVEDNGRGVPIGMNKKLKKSTPEVIFSVLHAGGKFGGGGYKTSGGLHGVGSSVVNALSTRFDVTIYREGEINEIKFKDGGKIAKPLMKVGTTKKTGTTINFLPDSSIFSSTKFHFSTISERLKESAFLSSGLEIHFTQMGSEIKQVDYKFTNGLAEFVKELIHNHTPITPVVQLQGNEKGIDVEIALSYTEDYKENVLGFANNVKTVDGGTHLTGFKTGLNKAINNYALEIGLLKEKDARLDSNDLKEGLTAIVSVKVPEELIQYEGQTKGKLGTSEARAATETIMNQNFTFWLKENKELATIIIEKALLARKAREEARKARQAIRNAKGKTKTKAMLGKLMAASGKDKTKNELFLVEGDSAAGSARKGRDSKIQAILPLKGKVINSEKAKIADLLKNEEINTIISAIGAGVGSEFDLEDSNYQKIIIMTDADTDGAHIQTLLLTFFYRYMKELIEEHQVYIALPPLYQIIFNDQKSIYLWDETDLEKFVQANQNKRYELKRFKGLGEMDDTQLWETTMDPSSRKLIQVDLEDGHAADRAFKVLMGDNVEKRKEWIQENIKFTLEDEEAGIIL